jgi:hypothetical protein
MGGLTFYETGRVAAFSRVSEPATASTLANFYNRLAQARRLQFAALLGEYRWISAKS